MTKTGGASGVIRVAGAPSLRPKETRNADRTFRRKGGGRRGNAKCRMKEAEGRMMEEAWGGVWTFSIRHSAFCPSPTPCENVITGIARTSARGMGHPRPRVKAPPVKGGASRFGHSSFETSDFLRISDFVLRPLTLALCGNTYRTCWEKSAPSSGESRPPQPSDTGVGRLRIADCGLRIADWGLRIWNSGGGFKSSISNRQSSIPRRPTRGVGR